MSVVRKILLVDDSLLSRLSIKKFLDSSKYSIEEASDGIEALEMIAKEIPDLVILDLLMPNLDGIGVLERLKSENINVPVVIVSADIQNTTKALCFKLGAVDFLNKPLGLEKLSPVLEGIFGKELNGSD